MDGIDEARRRIREEKEQKTGKLDLRGLGLTELPEEIGELGHLKELDIAFIVSSHEFRPNPITDLSLLGGLVGLQNLNCYGTEVSDIRSLANLHSLQILNCACTQVSDLGPLANLHSLQKLNLNAAKVSGLGPLAKLRSLQELNCACTQVSDLGRLADLHSLQKLDCSETQVKDLEPLANLHSLQKLACDRTQVANLGPLTNLHSLQKLYCSEAHVSDLEPLANLHSLRNLDCSLTKVSDLKPLANLHSLQDLNCAMTSVSDLSPLANLRSLQNVQCRGTRVTDLGPLANIHSLQNLDCSGMWVTDLRPLANLNSLRRLVCTGTQVSDLTPLLGLEKLDELRAGYCRLIDLPTRLVARLSKLTLRQASVPGLPGEVLSDENCLPRLRAHLADLEAGAVEVRRAKLVVLGNGRVGKTQICRQLQGLPFDPAVPSTHGICVSNVACDALGPGEELNLWDFGGQDIYHGTHALFMRTRSLFVIVWHPDFEQAGEESRDGVRFRNYPLAYWLDYVRTLGDAQSPVIVVQSRCDRPELEARRLPAESEGIRFLKQCWHSAKEGRGKATLIEAISDGVRHLREREGVSVIGKGRAKVIEILEGWRKEDASRPREERQHRTLSQADFRTLCENTGGISSPESLLDYLHQLGVVFYQPGLFSDAIILDQSWALDAVYAVFEREKSFRQIANMGGRFTRSLLDMTVWGEYSRKEQELFLSLMQSAGVCFVRRKADGKLDLETEYVAPDLLPDRATVADQLSGRWTEGEGQRIEFQYPFLHTGLMRGLICDAGKLAGDNGVYWKYGVWVYDRESGARALIEMHETDQHGGRVCAWVQQGRPERLARWLRQRFAEQNRRFGYPDLRPTIDELPIEEVEAALPCKPGDAPESCDKHARATATEPALGPMPAKDFPRKGPELFISYAWGDDSDEGKRRDAVVDSLCVALTANNVAFHRDKADMKSGDRIKEFMDRLIAGDLIVAILSDKYLRSPFCMYELFSIYRRCGDRPAGFLEHVIPLVLPDAKVTRPVDRLKYAAYWKQQRDELDEALRGLDDVAYAGVEIIKEYRFVDEFARNVADMLTFLNDKLMPRDLDRMNRDGFADILALIRKGQR